MRRSNFASLWHAPCEQMRRTRRIAIVAKFYFKCPQCGKSIGADDSLQGQVGECPSCGKGIVIPPRPSSDLKKTQRLTFEERDANVYRGQITSQSTEPQSLSGAQPHKSCAAQPECWSLAFSLASLAICIVSLIFTVPLQFTLQAGVGLALLAMAFSRVLVEQDYHPGFCLAAGLIMIANLVLWLIACAKVYDRLYH